VPGVLAGVAMAACSTSSPGSCSAREVAVLVAIFALVDGMLFVQSRIGMNDAYVGVVIVAAYTLFAALWTATGAGEARSGSSCRSSACSSGWRSPRNGSRCTRSAGSAADPRPERARPAAAILGARRADRRAGHLALVVPEGGGLGNIPFVAIMIGLTALAVVINVLHPIAWSDDEMRFAVAAPAAIGVLVGLAAVAVHAADTELAIGPFVVTPLHVAGALILLSILIYGAFVAGGRMGIGPLAGPPDASDPAALLPPPAPPPREAWLRPGALLGLPLLWMAICLFAIPVGLYVVSYIPWALIDNHQLFTGWPPGHTGQTLVELTQQMYDYHNNLTAGHAASSPWWAWPLDLKPVWFYQEGLAGGTTAAIYDAGNLVIWWLGIPAMAFVAWQAYARRSLALALVVIAFLCQWIAWARIDRAAFQYHYYTSLPFVIMALAYFAAELWHGASRRTWLFAKVAAGVAIMGPAILWVLARPLCGFVGVDRAVPDSAACPPIIPDLVVSRPDGGRHARRVRRRSPRSSTGSWTADLSGEGVNRALVRLAAIAGGAILGIIRRDRRRAAGGDRRLQRVPGRAPRPDRGGRARVPRGLRGDPRDGPAVRRRDRDRGGWLVPRRLPELLGAAAAHRRRERVPGPAADLPLPVPVPEQSGRGREGRQAARPGRARPRGRGRAPVPRAGVLGVGLADRNRGARGGRVGRVGRRGGVGGPGG
jgi:hypothetical protein